MLPDLQDGTETRQVDLISPSEGENRNPHLQPDGTGQGLRGWFPQGCREPRGDEMGFNFQAQASSR